MNKKYFWSGYIIGVICFISTGIFFYLKSMESPKISINSISVFDMNGKKVNTNKFIGKPIVVNFWATWCSPCIKEFPEFKNIQDKYGDKVVFLMISDENISKIKIFKIKNIYKFEYLASHIKFEKIGLNSRPATYFYNKKGELISKKIGSINVKILDESIQNIMIK